MKTNEYTMFKISKPWGYYPPAVESKIGEYENLLREMNNKYQESKQIIISQQQTIENLQEELRNMHLEMSNIQLPDVEEAVQGYVLDSFKNYNSRDDDECNNEPIEIETNDVKFEHKALNLNKNSNGELIISSQDDDQDNDGPSFEIVT